MTTLHKRTARAVLWSAFDVFMRQGLQFVITIVLARLLSPEDFGVIAMLYAFTAIASLFIDSGFSSAIIQCQDVTKNDESTVFFFNLGMAALVSLLLSIAAPTIANFFEQPVLRPLIYIMSVNLLIGAFGSVHSILLAKHLMFKTLMKVGVVSSTISGVLTVFLAYKGYGVWSLAWPTLVSSCITVSLLWVLHPWRPNFVFSAESCRKLFRFGGFLFLSGLLDVIYTRMHAFLIGKLFSIRDLGFYSRALNTRQMTSNTLESIFNRVAFPVFSSAASDKNLLKRGVKKSLMVMMFINVPAMLGIATVANPLVTVLFGDKWLPSVPILQVLCLAGIIWPLHSVNLNALMAQGRSDLFFRIELIKKAIGILATFVACFYGVMAIAWVQILTGGIAFWINSHYTGSLLDYGATKQIKDTLPFLLSSVIMALLTILLEKLMQFSPFVELLILVAFGSFIYITLIQIFFKTHGISMILNMFAHLKNK